MLKRQRLLKRSHQPTTLKPNQLKRKLRMRFKTSKGKRLLQRGRSPPRRWMMRWPTWSRNLLHKAESFLCR